MREKEVSGRPPVERRRFLRESLRGSLPLLIGWATASARSLARLLQESPAERRISPPPMARTAAPRPAQDELERRREEFAHDNPNPPDFSST